MSLRKESLSLKGKIRSLLLAGDYEGLVELSREKDSVIRRLMPFTYDKSDVLCWRAVEAIGRITSLMPRERVRTLIQRVLWMMRDESGGNPWSGAEMIGEIIRQNPEDFREIVPVVVSFHEEEMFRPGALWTLARLAGKNRGLVEPFSDIPLGYLSHRDPTVRGNALLALKAMGKPGAIPVIADTLDERGAFRYYNGEALVEKSIKDAASEAIAALRQRQ